MLQTTLRAAAIGLLAPLPFALAQATLGAPVRLQAAGQPIDADIGHAAPYLMDWDGDGLVDLLVGEFGQGEFDRNRLPPAIAKSSLELSLGKLRIYRNLGTATEPLYGDFQYLQAAGGDACIPTT